MLDFVDNLVNLTGDQRAALKHIGAETPVALLSALESNPEAYERFLGRSLFARLIFELGRLLTPDERHRLNALPSVDYQLGALMNSTSPDIHKSLLHEERDRLYRELRQLKAGGDPSEAVRESIQSVQHRLNTVLRCLRDAA